MKAHDSEERRKRMMNWKLESREVGGCTKSVGRWVKGRTSVEVPEQRREAWGFSLGEGGPGVGGSRLSDLASVPG